MTKADRLKKLNVIRNNLELVLEPSFFDTTGKEKMLNKILLDVVEIIENEVREAH